MILMMTDEVAKYCLGIEGLMLLTFEKPLVLGLQGVNYLLHIDPGYHGQRMDWREDGYCNGGNLPGAYIVGNTLRYQNLEWYDALKDIKLKEKALKNKSIMEEMIDDNGESSNNGWRRWDGYETSDHDQEERKYENEDEDEERSELFDDHELPVFTVKKIRDDRSFHSDKRKSLLLLKKMETKI
ncbi:hypothetical protein Tco_0907639 [Tanacetum coccineum]|uniref:Uncharacterized protein n=1 Tax=Tanacetum coccineum TaxID=301880 RepID=A0ABQ5CKX4_9ASTR